MRRRPRNDGMIDIRPRPDFDELLPPRLKQLPTENVESDYRDGFLVGRDWATDPAVRDDLVHGLSRLLKEDQDQMPDDYSAEWLRGFRDAALEVFEHVITLEVQFRNSLLESASA